MKKKPYLLGVMQGRLLPKYKGYYQAHPVGMWQKEFEIAKDLKLDFIEFIFDSYEPEHNPLTSHQGLQEIRTISTKTGIKVNNVCADYFRDNPLHSVSTNIVNKSVTTLVSLIENCAKINIKEIMIPLVEKSSLTTEKSMQEFAAVIKNFAATLNKHSIKLSFETDLPPEKVIELLNMINIQSIAITYDVGDSASLDYNITEEFKTYEKYINTIHIKDRIKGGFSVALGTGNVNFDRFCQELVKRKQQNILTMQAYRDDEGLALFQKQLTWFKNKLDFWYEKKEEVCQL